MKSFVWGAEGAGIGCDYRPQDWTRLGREDTAQEGVKTKSSHPTALCDHSLMCIATRKRQGPRAPGPGHP